MTIWSFLERIQMTEVIVRQYPNKFKWIKSCFSSWSDEVKLRDVLVQVIAWFVVIFGVNTTSDISKLLYLISQAARWVKFETILNFVTSGIYAKNHVQIMLLFVYITTRRGFVIFTCRYFKFSWNTTALSQSSCSNFSCSSITLYYDDELIN